MAQKNNRRRQMPAKNLTDLAAETQDSAAAAVAVDQFAHLSEQELRDTLQAMSQEHTLYRQYTHFMADKFLALEDAYKSAPSIANRPAKMNFFYVLKNWKEIISFVLQVIDVLSALFQKLQIKREEALTAENATA